MIDASKLQYYTGYNAYKNLQVHQGSIAVDNASVASGTTRTWSSTVIVQPNSKFSNASIQNNRDNYPVGVTALKWASFPSANTVWQTLQSDPDGLVTHPIQIYLSINNNQVTFSGTTFNDSVSAFTFNPINIGFVYAIHTLVL